MPTSRVESDLSALLGDQAQTDKTVRERAPKELWKTTCGKPINYLSVLRGKPRRFNALGSVVARCTGEWTWTHGYITGSGPYNLSNGGPEGPRPLSTDPNDDMVLDVAIYGRADAIVTFNTKHFKSAATQFNIDVISPAELLTRICSRR
jgi:hypothetical protein